MVFIGIDVGKNGGLALICGDDFVSAPWDREEFVSLMEDIHLCGDKAFVVVEKVGAMPKQGVTSMFNFGKSAGFIEGVLWAYRIPFQLVPPQTWKKEFSLGSDKQQSIEVCKRLFPTVDLHRTARCKKEHDGMAEALLMAEYARRKMGGAG